MSQVHGAIDASTSNIESSYVIALPPETSFRVDATASAHGLAPSALIEAAAHACVSRRFEGAYASWAGPRPSGLPDEGLVRRARRLASADAGHGAQPAEIRFRAADGGQEARLVLRLSASPERGGSRDLQLSLRGPRSVASALDLPRLADSIGVLLEAALRAPDAPLESLPLLGDAEAARLREWTATHVDFDRNATVDRIIWAHASRWPDRIAVRTASASVDFGTLLARADDLANRLRARGIGTGHTVGIYVERDVAMVVAMLGVLRSGAAYVPLDPTYPVSRLLTMIADASLAAIVTQPTLARSTPWVPEDALQVLPDGRLHDALDAVLQDRPAATHDAGSPAYLIYTSGSTGRPKGVLVPHRAVVNLLGAMRRRFPLEPGDTVLTVTTLSFDIAVLEILLPLLQGATLFLATRADAADGRALRSLVERHRVRLMQATPATWRLLQDEGWPGSPTMCGLVGGEPLPKDLASWMRRSLGEAWNMYGPTETTVWSTCWRIEARERGVGIGAPIDNTAIRVLDASGHPCPIGTEGEICIGGEGVAIGYHHRPELTAERFVPDPFSDAPDARLYRTGDLGRWAEDGLLEHLGRLDAQLKVRGYRIEPGEVEAALSSHPAVKRCAVAGQPGADGTTELAAHVVLQAGAVWDEAALREHLRRLVPHYMLPRHVVEIAELPLTPNGKVDRRALLPVHDAGPGIRADAPAVATALERDVCALWARVLGTTDVGVADNFFDLGGHSLLAARLLPEMERLVGVPIEPRRLIFESLRQLCTQQVALDGSDRAEPIARPPDGWLAGLLRRVSRTGPERS